MTMFAPKMFHGKFTRPPYLLSSSDYRDTNHSKYVSNVRSIRVFNITK